MLLFREPLSQTYGPERGMFVLIVVSIGITIGCQQPEFSVETRWPLRNESLCLQCVRLARRNVFCVSRQSAEQVLHKCMARFKLRFFNKLVRLMGLSNIAWTADDG